jgi:ATP-dependent exoDNAse (exonuclease V) beta subunit
MFNAELVTDSDRIKKIVLQDFWRTYFYNDPDNFKTALEKKWNDLSKLLKYMNLLLLPSEPAIKNFKKNDKTPNDWSFFYFSELLKFSKQRLYKEKKHKNIMFFDDLICNLRDALNSGNGKILSDIIRKKYPVALVDEFQDTDDAQYAIFQKLYNDRSDCSFFMIGDPKQAIYSFRGADIFAYIKAKNSANPEKNQFTLDTNWRSEKSMLEAVNLLFSNTHKPFLFDEIPYHNINAAGSAEADKNPLLFRSEKPKPLQLWLIKRNKENTGKRSNEEFVISKEWAFSNIASGIAGEISRLIISGSQGLAKIHDRNLAAKDIAILVRSHRQAQLIQDALNKFGISSVYIGKESVYNTEEAQELYYLLNAIISPLDDNMLFAALSTKIMGYNLAELIRIKDDENQYHKITSKFYSYYETWKNKGFLVMFYRILNEENFNGKLLMFDDGERRLTNLMQLAELLSVAERDINGNKGLLRWLSEKTLKDTEKSEEDQLRLESDEELVKILTIHKSKGLEFPIVFLPFIWDGKELPEDEPFLYHDILNNNEITFNPLIFNNSRYKELKSHEEKFNKALKSYDDKLQKSVSAGQKKGAGSKKTEESLEKARKKLEEARNIFEAISDELKELEEKSRIFTDIYEKAEAERLSEDLRLLYVALTRSKYICYLTFGIINDYYKSAISYILGIDQPGNFKSDNFEHGDQDIGIIKDLWLEKMNDHDEYINFIELDINKNNCPPLPFALRNNELSAKKFTGSVVRRYDVKSFSSLSPGFEQPEDNYDNIEIYQADLSNEIRGAENMLILPEKTSEDTISSEILSEFTFPKGTNTGILFHAFLEEIDLKCLNFDEISEKSKNYLSRFGIDNKWNDVFSTMALNAMTTFLDDNKTLRLSDIENENKITELEFYFRASQTNASKLNEILRCLDDFMKYNVKLLNFDDFRGYIKGYVDLVFKHNHKYYILDYKTNFLGASIEDYNKNKLTSSIYEHSYYLQYTLYTLALHRYLNLYIENYDYDTHFEGIYYLFLRGMRAELGNGYGVYFNRPQRHVIEKLDRLFLEG